MATNEFTSIYQHQFEMMNNMKLILDEEQLCDVVLIGGLDAKRIPTNRLVLSAASEYFKAMFTGSMKEAKEKEITLDGIDGDILQTLVTHCFNGDLMLREDNVEKILSAAHLMQFISIVNKCAEFLKNQLSPSNCLGVKFIAERLNCIELEAQAHKFICENFNQVSKSDEFLQLSADQLDILLSLDDLSVSLEEDIFDSLLSWVKHDELNRKTNIRKLLLNVRMPLMDPQFLSKRVRSVCKSNKCMDLYYEALEWKLNPDDCPDIDVKRIILRNFSGNLLVSKDGKYEMYCLQTKQWTFMNKMNFFGSSFRVTVWNEKLVVVGVGSLENAVKYWDVKLKIWKNLGRLNTSRRCIALTVFGESLYAMGGYDYDNRYWVDTVERLDSLTGSWQSVARMPIEIKIPQAAVFDGCIYLEGTYHEYVGRLLKFNPNINEWTDLGATSKNPISLFVINNNLYAIRNNEIKKYNKEKNTWTICTDKCPDIKRSCTFNDRLFVIAYENGKLILKEYRLSDNLWIDLAPLTMDRVDNFLYIPSVIV